MMRTSDLFCEEDGLAAAAPLSFSDPVKSFSEGFDILSAEGESGSYRSVFCGPLWTAPPEAGARFVRALRGIFAGYRRRLGIAHGSPVLVCGIGNENAAADALGPRTAGRILATDQVMREAGLPSVSAVRAGLPRETGIDTAVFVRALARELSVSLVVTVDALCAKSRERLGTVAQITDCGITPGSALGHSSGEISRRTMPCPVLSVGVPTVIRSDVLAGGEREEDPLFVSRADTDAMVSRYALLLASALNGVFSGKDGSPGISAQADA